MSSLNRVAWWAKGGQRAVGRLGIAKSKYMVRSIFLQTLMLDSIDPESLGVNYSMTYYYYTTRTEIRY